MRRLTTILLSFFVFALSANLFAAEPWYITDVKLGVDNNVITSNRGTNSMTEISPLGEVLNSWSLPNTPTAFVVEGEVAYITCFDGQHRSSIVVLDMANGDVEEVCLPKHSGVTSPVLSADGRKIYLCNKFKNSISEYDIASKEVTNEVDVLREPVKIVVDKQGRYMYVLNFLPAQQANLDHVGCELSVVDIASFKKIKDIKLENGSNALRGATLSPDGRYLFISHNLGRYTVPTSQLQQGWMNTSALSVVDTKSLTFTGAILVDEAERGAAGTWGVACDDEHLYVSHSGTHEVSVIDYPSMIAKYESYSNKSVINYDLHFLYGIRERVRLEGNGAREFVLSDGVIIVPTYFSDHLNFYDTASRELRSYALNPNRVETDAQVGEKIFNDAVYCFQSWQSCNGCHPGDGRTDGLNWDLMNDGVGNSKNCKSLLLSLQTPPSMITGIRASGYVANRAGFKFIQFHEISEQSAKCIDAYILSLRAVESPYLVDGELSEGAAKGRKVYEKLRCDECHSGPYYTDLKRHRIGEDVEFEQGWDTPTLVEVWRTAPYLFDGRAYTLHDVFGVHRHGVKKKISKSDLDDLVEYVNSL